MRSFWLLFRLFSMFLICCWLWCRMFVLIFVVIIVFIVGWWVLIWWRFLRKIVIVFIWC